MKPRSSTATPAASAPIAAAVGPAADGHQHRVEHVLSGAVGALERDVETVLLGLDARDLGLQANFLVALLDPLGERRDDVAIRARNQLVHHFDDADLRAQGVIDRRHLEADDAAAEDQQPLGDVEEFERAGRSPRCAGSFGMKPGAIGSEPAAMIALAKRTIFVPSAVSTARVCGEANLPSPVTTTTLRWRARPVSPVVSRLTTLSFQLRTPPRSTLGAPNLTPCAPKSAASSITLATCSNAFEGMQPTLRQTPPSVLCRSTSTTFCPRSAARKAAV